VSEAPSTIVEYPDARLRQIAAPVAHFDEALRDLTAALLDTLYATPGVALSAPQLGVDRRALVLDLSDDRSAPEVYVNPEIVARRGFGLSEESCLSLPGVTGNVVRSAQVLVRAVDADGVSFEREADGLRAICLQHEVDHLEGTLFVDRLWWPGRMRWRALGARRFERARRAAVATPH
jgi:peptide deformylase